MEARCKDCSSRIIFRATRGGKLSNYKCKCGGQYERMNSVNIEGNSPNDDISPTIKLYATWGTASYNAYENRSGVLFLLDHANNKFITNDSI